MGDDFEIVKLAQRPCCVKYLDLYDAFLVGTYELLNCKENAIAKSSHLAELNEEQLDSHLIKINWRLGSFVVIKQDADRRFRIINQFICDESGGVFDFVIAYQNDKSLDIYAAHSNGTLGKYKLEQIDNHFWLSNQKQQDVPQTKMLTCIDKLPSEQNPKDTIVVGSSEGVISLFEDSKLVIQKLCHTKDPIWQVRCVKLSLGRNIIIVGSEDSFWYLYYVSLSSECDLSLQLLYKSPQDEYSAGITCIIQMNCDIHHKSDERFEAIEILVGSYDETFKCYRLTFDSGHSSNIELPKPQVELVFSKSIVGGGVWRIKQIYPADENGNGRLYVAAMYAGSYKLCGSLVPSIGGRRFEWTEPKELVEHRSLKFDEKPLHYDIDYSPSSSACCIADFNNGICLIRYDRQTIQ